MKSIHIIACGKCDFECEDDNELTRHTETSHTYSWEKFVCQLCDYNCIKENDLKHHSRTKHNQFKFDICDVSLKTDKKLQNHICKVHIKNP